MDREESWRQFWGSGRIEDYLRYSACEREGADDRCRNVPEGEKKDRYGRKSGGSIGTRQNDFLS